MRDVYRIFEDEKDIILFEKVFDMIELTLRIDRGFFKATRLFRLNHILVELVIFNFLLLNYMFSITEISLDEILEV